MAQLDVTEVLSDPDFADDTLVCERASVTTDTLGRDSATLTLLPFTGVVTSDAGALLKRMAMGERIEDSITIHTTFLLTAGDATRQLTADTVRWKGKRWTVSAVNDYSHFGAGFVGVTCDLIPVGG